MKKLFLLLSFLVALIGVSVGQTYDIFIWTQDQGGLPMGGVTVELDGETITTDSGPMGGEAIFTGKAPGDYTYTASATGYATVTGTVSVVDQNATATAQMLPVYDIFIWTQDQNMLPMGGVTVTLDGESITTDSGPMGGEAVFTGKLPGEYTFTATATGYATVTGTVTVVDQNATGTAQMFPVYDIFIWTQDQNMLPMGGVTVELDGESITTDSGPMGGEAIFTGKLPGDYTFTATAPGYATVTGTITVVDQNATGTAQMFPVYDIFIWTQDQNMLPLGGVTVTLDGESITTDSGPMGGEAIFTGKLPGEYTYTASAPGYATVTGTVTVVDQNATATAQLFPAYDIFIWTQDQNMLPLGGVTVTLDGESITTDSGPMGGEAIFTGKLPGEYTYTASAPGYATVTGTVTVVDQNATATAQLFPAYDIFIWTQDQNMLPMGGVTVELDGESITTDSGPMGGEAIFTGKLPGEYTYTATAPGYATVTGTVTVVDQNATATVQMVQVFDIFIWTQDQNMLPMGGVTVELDGESITTDSGPMGGEAIFSGKLPGEYTYTATAPGYATVTGTVTVVDQNATATVQMVQVFDIFIWTQDQNMLPMGGVSVELDGESITTDSGPMGGEAIFSGKLPGDYTYTATADGYATVTGTVTVVDQNATATVQMIPVYNISFVVSDGSTMIEGAVVTIGQDTWTTDAMGEVVVTAMEAGSYDYTVTADGFADNNGSVTIVDADVTEIVTMSLPTYNVTFTINDGTNAIEGATVTFDGTDINTDANGNAVFSEVLNGTYEYSVSFAGYDTETGNITVADADANETVSLSMTTYSVTFVVNDGTNAIDGATVTFDGTDASTDASGNAVFNNVVPGTFDYSIAATDYNTESGSITLSDADITETVSMTLATSGIGQVELKQVKVYPNPASEYIIIDLGEYDFENASINVLNLNGQSLIQTVERNKEPRIDISDLVSGMYILEVKSGNESFRNVIIVD